MAAPARKPQTRPWVQLDAMWRQLAPTILQFLAALMPYGVFKLFDQGADVLSMIAEDLTRGYWKNPVIFLAASFAAATAIWYSARTLLSLDYDGLTPPDQSKIGKLRGWLQEWWPRSLAWVSVSMVAVCFFLRILAYSKNGEQTWFMFWLGAMGVLHLALIYPLWRIMRFRRDWVQARTGATANMRHPDLDALIAAAPDTLGVTYGFLVGSTVLLIVIWFFPIKAGRFLGTGAMLSFAAMTSVSLGSVLMWVRAKTKIPTVFLLVVWVLFCSHVMDNHAIRLTTDIIPGTKPEETFSEPPLDDALQSWDADMQKLHPASTAKVQPIFIVATEGGGIRAAYWTALVLSSVQEPKGAAKDGLSAQPQPDFASQLFAISGISGGSVGAAVFDALLADGRGQLRVRSKAILGQDGLAPLIGGLLFPDAFQRCWPFTWPHTDRATFLENSWEEGYQETDPNNHDNRLALPFRSLWPPSPKAPTRLVPHLLLNSTLVETGQRIIFSDLAITSFQPKPFFMDAVDAHALLVKNTPQGPAYHDVPLSTAAHASARFTYSNPPGTLPNGQHFVDGGYFEDSGATTALELIQEIETWNDPAKHPAVRYIPVVIVISNDPRTLPNGGQAHPPSEVEQKEATSKTEQAPKPKTAEEKSEESPWAPELLSPPEALMQTRSARGAFARRSLYEHQRHALGRLINDPDIKAVLLKAFPNVLSQVADNSSDEQTPNYIQFSVIKEDGGAPLPLGWSLSHAAQENLDNQIDKQPVNISAKGLVDQWLGRLP
ncbi:MAG: hypothetical protein P4L99_15980 [Chthoniobacter sp.]|nr:hypothetical protein [Chthoniobacter sp.]